MKPLSDPATVHSTSMQFVGLRNHDSTEETIVRRKSTDAFAGNIRLIIALHSSDSYVLVSASVTYLMKRIFSWEECI